MEFLGDIYCEQKKYTNCNNYWEDALEIYENKLLRE